MAASDDVQLTVLVKSLVLVSENVAVAVKCCVSPSGTIGATGATVSDTKAGPARFSQK